MYLAVESAFRHPYRLIAAPRLDRVGMNLDMGRIDHQPLIIRVTHQAFPQSSPNPFVPPTAKAPMRVLPVSIRFRQVSPRRACAKNPGHAIDELPVIPRQPYPRALPAGKMRLQK
jgi:hypothetical protein